MKRATRLTLSCAVLSLIGVPALAQQDGAMSGIDPKALTCADIVTMDPEQVPGALYFVAGYMHGSDAGGTDAATMPEATTAPATTAPAATDPAASGADTTAEGADAGAMTGTASAPDAGGSAADPGTSAMDDTATTGSTTAAPETADAPAATGSATGSATGTDPAAPATDATSDMAATETGMVMVDGMFAIPLADVVTMCTQSPEMLVSDALVQHRDGAGTTTN